VPAQDWCFVGLGEPKGFPAKSQETPNQGGRPKQEVAISANGMKHLLAHVPNQELLPTVAIEASPLWPTPGTTPPSSGGSAMTM
jgi:hypothetical protein